MGYTHYFTPSTSKISQATLDTIKLVLRHGMENSILETEGTNGVDSTPDHIIFNGIGDYSHETFSYEPGGTWAFCKTARKPYDLYVCATLLILKFYLPGMEFNSDGNADDWKDAIKFLIENEEEFSLNSNLTKSLREIGSGEQGDQDLFQYFPTFSENNEVSFTFANFCSFSLGRKEGESDEELKERAKDAAIEILAGDLYPVCHECSNPLMID